MNGPLPSDTRDTRASTVTPVFIPGRAAIADLKLLLRGVRLPVSALGGTLASSELGVDEVRLGMPSDIGEQMAEAGAGVLADEDARPIANLTGAVVDRRDGHTTVVQGAVEPVDGAAWTPLAESREQGGMPRAVVVVSRPPLPADVAELRAISERQSLVVVVPIAGPSPDRLPAHTLLRLTEQAVNDAGIEPVPDVVPVELFRRDASTDPVLERQVARVLGATDATVVTAAASDWARLLRALDSDEPLPPLADAFVLRELRRWRPPRSRRGVVVLLTGLSGAGKSTLARALAARIRDTTERTVSLLDGDLVRRLLSSGLGFDHASRDLNVRRNGFVAAEIARHGGIAICALIAPYAESRAAIRAMTEEVGDFVLVHVSTPLAEAERRDVKGLYARARAGVLQNFTGISDPYDEPTDADITVDTSAMPFDECLERIVRFLEDRGSLPPAPHEG